MTTTRSRFPILATTLLLSAVAALAPAPAAADCGAGYVTCLAGTTGFDSSDSLHEQECRSAYMRCISRMLIAF